MISGSVPLRMQSAVMTTRRMLGSLGTSYITRVMVFSMTLRKPRAPISMAMALSAMASRASSS